LVEEALENSRVKDAYGSGLHDTKIAIITMSSTIMSHSAK